MKDTDAHIGPAQCPETVYWKPQASYFATRALRQPVLIVDHQKAGVAKKSV